MLILLIHGRSLSYFFLYLQQVHTYVWDVSSQFKIALVKASKVNAEETAKVRWCFVHINKTVMFLLLCACINGNTQFHTIQNIMP